MAPANLLTQNDYGNNFDSVLRRRLHLWFLTDPFTPSDPAHKSSVILDVQQTKKVILGPN